MRFYRILLMMITVFLMQTGQSQVNNRSDEELDQVTHTIISYLNPDSVLSYIQDLQDMQTRFAMAGNRREVAEYIKNKLWSFGFDYMFNAAEVRLDSFELEMEWPWGSGNILKTWQYNVELSLQGHTFPERVYVIGAHHDAITWNNPVTLAPGADDNASGVAAVLEIARVLAKYDYIPESTIRFVTFAAEELGLIGAYDYAAKADESDTDIIMMLNCDMISNCEVEEEDWTVQLHHYPNSDEVTELAEQIIEKFTILDHVKTDKYINGSDSYAFYEYDYPAIFFHENDFSPFYHSDQDIVANINKHYATEVIKVPLGMLIRENKYGWPVKTLDTQKLKEISKAYPNPFDSRANIVFTLQKPSVVQISIFNEEGKMIEVIGNSMLPSGEHSVVWDSKDKLPGMYFCRILTSENDQFITLIKQHQ